MRKEQKEESLRKHSLINMNYCNFNLSGNNKCLCHTHTHTNTNAQLHKDKHNYDEECNNNDYYDYNDYVYGDECRKDIYEL